MRDQQLLIFPFTVPLDGSGNMHDAAQGIYGRSLARALAERLSDIPLLHATPATLTAHGSPERPSDDPTEYGWVVATQPWSLDEALQVSLPEGTQTLLHGAAELTDRVRMRLLLVDQPKKSLALDCVVLRPRAELFAALDEAAGSVAAALGQRLPRRPWPTTDVEAYVAYLRGRDMSAAVEAGVHVQEPERSFEGYLEAVRRDPEFDEAQDRLLSLALDVALQGKGLSAVARRACERLLSCAPAAFKAHATLAKIALAEDKPAEAVAHLNALLELKDDFWPAFERMGTALLRLDKAAEALSWFERARIKNPDDADALFGLGVCLAEAGRLDEAVAAWTDVLALDDQGPRGILLHTNLARALDSLGRTREANRHRAKLRKLQGRPRFGLGWLKDELSALFHR